MVFLKAVFASWIPEITELAAQRNKYGGKYNKDVRKRYTPGIMYQINFYSFSLVSTYFLIDLTESIRFFFKTNNKLHFLFISEFEREKSLKIFFFRSQFSST